MNKSDGGLVSLLAEGFSLPLAGLVILIGGLYGFSQYEGAISTKAPADSPQPPPETRGGDPVDPPETDGSPSRPAASSEEIRALIDAGDYDEALKQARKAGARKLADEALLYQTLTRSITPNAFATEPLLQMTTKKGETLVGHLAGEVNGVLTINLPDGMQRKVSGNGLQARDELTGEERALALSHHFSEAGTLLGDDANGLALHRLSFLALACGERRVGTQLLRSALTGNEGGILVDMFGEGDFDRLHRTRRRLAGLPEKEPTQLAMANTGGSQTRDPGGSQTRDPGGSQTPEPEPEPEPYDEEPYEEEPEPETPPEPLTSDKRVERRAEYDLNADPALNDRRWRDADEAYRSGLELYRGSFGVSPTIANAAIRASLKEFSRAQQSLDSLMTDHRDHLIVERRAQEINQLIIDCMKRQSLETPRRKRR